MPDAESHLLAGVGAVQVDAVGIGEHLGIAVGRRPHQDRAVSFVQRLAVEFGIAGHRACQARVSECMFGGIRRCP